MKTNFEAGQTVYSEHGEQAEYVAATGDGHIVRPVVEAYSQDGEDSSYDHVCDPTMWRNVFPEPPVAKYGADLKALHDQIAAAKAERQRLENEDWQRQRDRAAKLKKFAVLDNLELFIDGKITHYVETGSDYSPPEIIALADAKSRDSDNYRKTLRLLTLGGNIKNGDVQWVLSEYSDGSGGGSRVQPCTSYEQAAEIVKAAIVRRFESGCKDPRQAWIDAADKFGVAVSEQYRQAVAQLQITTIERNLNWTRTQAENAAETLRKAEEELAQLRAYVIPAAAQEN